MRIVQPLARLGITPNLLTAIGLLLSVLTAVVIAQGYLRIGGFLVLFAGIFDMFDGALARVRHASTTFGAFFDSTLDRYSESIILFGLLYYALQRPGLQETLWPTSHEQTWMIIFIYVASIGSLLVSYTKARAEGLGIECKTGLLARPERVIILAVGLLLGISIWMLAFLAVFSNVTAIERIITVWRNIRKAETAQKQVSTNQQDTNANNRPVPREVEADEARGSVVRHVPTSVPPFTGSVRND